MKKLIVFALVSLLLSACEWCYESENADFLEAGESRHNDWTLEYQTTVGELYFCTYTRTWGYKGYAFTTPSETPCKERL